jgi:hypothetical protein
MKKHLKLDVTANHVLQRQQFPEHETPTADIFPAGAVPPWEEKHLRKTSREVPVGRSVRVPHDRLKAGQMVVDTHRVHDIIENGPVSLPRDIDDRPPEAQQLPSGEYMLQDGHHRIAARILTGRKTSTVYVGHRWEKP